MSSTLIEFPISAGDRPPARPRALRPRHRRARSCPRSTAPTMDVVDPATGLVVAQAATGSAADVDRAARSARAAFDDGRWRDVPPLEKERRLRRLSPLVAEHGDELAEIDVIDAGLLRIVHGVHRAVRRRRHRLLRRARRRSSRARCPPCPADFAVLQIREPIGVIGVDHAVERPDGRARLRRRRPRRRQLGRAQAGRADADGGGDRGRAGARGRASRPACSTSCRATGPAAGAALVEHPFVDAPVVHRLLADGQRHPGRGGQAGQAGEPRARRQEPVHRVPRRRPRGGVGHVDGAPSGAPRARSARAARGCSSTTASTTSSST